jgi:plasmid stabilization system protein ParE
MIDCNILPVAEAEYESAVNWYLTKSVDVASRFVIEVEEAIKSIRKQPDRFSRWDDTYRYCLLNKFPYYVAYRYAASAVTIVAIRHGAQDQVTWRGR